MRGERVASIHSQIRPGGPICDRRTIAGSIESVAGTDVARSEELHCPGARFPLAVRASRGAQSARPAGPDAAAGGSGVALLLDFDGTVTARDVGSALIARFARDDSWKVIDNDYESGRIGSRMAYRILEGLLAGTPEQWERFVLERFAVDAGLAELAVLAADRGWLVEILSDGLGWYIRALLGREGVRLPLRTNEAVCGEPGEPDADGPRLRIVTPYVNPRCGRCGTCKSERVDALAAAGWQVVYVGDGYSDLCPAPRAHRLFAKSVLAEHCRERGVPFEPFDTLGDVAGALRGEGSP